MEQINPVSEATQVHNEQSEVRNPGGKRLKKGGKGPLVVLLVLVVLLLGLVLMVLFLVLSL